MCNFNPRTREGCDTGLEALGRGHDLISIHAPVKGATVLPLSVLSWSISYFNPRTREGCDPASLLLRLILHHFNPRTREGCDCNAKLPDLLPAFISIHAPVKGATFSMSPTNTAIGISIHAPVKGATQGTTFYNSKPRISIHAPVKGATRIQSYIHLARSNISIHAPVKGATSNLMPGEGVMMIFQSTHP